MCTYTCVTINVHVYTHMHNYTTGSALRRDDMHQSVAHQPRQGHVPPLKRKKQRFAIQREQAYTAAAG